MGAAATPAAFASRGRPRLDLPPASVDRERTRIALGSCTCADTSTGTPPPGAELVELNRSLAQAYRDWMAPLLDSGEIRQMSMLMMTAIVTGPVHAIARRWLAGPARLTAHAYLDELVDAACAALSGTPASSRRRPHSLARHGRIRLELVTDDGSVIADGEATAELLPAHAGMPA